MAALFIVLFNKKFASIDFMICNFVLNSLRNIFMDKISLNIKVLA